ncbi:HEAT repeat domain-containing protein [Polluticoccus soli]|uniref:HEAT repeat domain-containing protein n=1 Tax=Polluticoccus soli TaxID=3034150 RepID=UPI0023E23866|nr:HEAT repeat domain-containing protein [Flavipsychrobacter sp. JY13-12]
MAFYDLSKPQRELLCKEIETLLVNDLQSDSLTHFLHYFSDEDTYIRKTAYLAVGRISKNGLFPTFKIIATLNRLLKEDDFKTRQATVNAAGEIGKTDFEIVQHFFDVALFDEHHAVRNAVIGSVKKMGEKNPEPVLAWARMYLHHADKEIRREICHGIELRGRTHPQDILPMLRELEFDKTARVRNTLVHVIGQISYKKGCLATVIEDLKQWQNKEVIDKAIDEIIDVHDRYKNFTILTQEEAIDYINQHYHRTHLTKVLS